MSVQSFKKRRIDQVVLTRDSDSMAIAVFTYPHRGWYHNGFIASVKSAFNAPAGKTEISNLPFWAKIKSSLPMDIWAVSGVRAIVPVGAVFASASWDSNPEIISKARFPIRGLAGPTYTLTVDIDGGGPTAIDLSAALTTNNGDLSAIITAINNTLGDLGYAFSAGSGEASRLGLRSLSNGALASIEVVTGGANDCSAILGFSLVEENLYDEGIDAVQVGSFSTQVDQKTG